MSPRLDSSTYLAVAIGGAFGAGLRAAANAGGESGASGSLMWVNLLGCFAAGMVYQFSVPGRRRALPAWLSIGLIAGFCGALTSYSSAVLLTVGILYVLSGPVVTVRGRNRQRIRRRREGDRS